MSDEDSFLLIETTEHRSITLNTMTVNIYKTKVLDQISRGFNVFVQRYCSQISTRDYGQQFTVGAFS